MINAFNYYRPLTSMLLLKLSKVDRSTTLAASSSPPGQSQAQAVKPHAEGRGSSKLCTRLNIN